jgi:Zn-dependent protease with chaperone function
LLLLLVLAFTGFTAGGFRLGVFALLGAILTAVLWPARGPLGTRPQSLSSGALRDRLFDLAHRAGVRLRGLYVVPMRRERMANAFAVHGGSVLVADELLDRMSRREVDAVLAHEITHLEHHHPIKALLAGLTVWALIAGITLASRIPYGFPLGLIAFLLAHRFVARRFEYAADAGAVALTGDAEGLVAGLGRLARLNDLPLDWGPRWEWWVTHPSTEARALAIARRARLARERVAELLASGLPPAERYGDRERPGEERVFSTGWKAAVSSRLGLALMAAGVIAPALALALARAAGLHVPHGVAIPAAAGLSLVAMLVVQDQFAARIVSRLEPALRARLASSTSDALDAERFVALAPGDRPRIYEGFHDWDLGFLAIDRQRICYRGEQVRWKLPRAAVCAIELGGDGPSWIRAPRVIVRWLGPSGEQAVALRAADCRTVHGIADASRVLAARLEAWRSGVSSQSLMTPSPMAPSSMAESVTDELESTPPAIGSVTSRTPAEAAAPRDLPLLVTLIGTLAAAASFALGFDFWLGVDVCAAALLGVMALRWPAMTSRDRARQSAAEPARRAA